MFLTNPYPMTHDGVEYPVTEIMWRWYENKTSLRVIQEFQNYVIVGDGVITQCIKKRMLRD